MSTTLNSLLSPPLSPPLSSPLSTVDVVVIGAGQAGLTAAHVLHRAGLAADHGFVVLDGGFEPGGVWAHRWPTVTMHMINEVPALPGFPLGSIAGDARAGDVVPAYCAAYEEMLGRPVRRPARVSAVRRAGGRLMVDSAIGTFAARAVIDATGRWARPFWPRYPGQADFTGAQLHAADYRGAQEFRDRHVIVVGGGTSALLCLGEISEVASTTWVTRSEPEYHESPFEADVDVEARRALVADLGRRAVAGLLPGSDAPPGNAASMTGLPMTSEVAALRDRGVLKRHPMFCRIVADGVRWSDGSSQAADVILWATGFRPALDHLRPLRLREAGGGIRVEGTRAVAEPRLHLLGYAEPASTVGAGRAAQQAVQQVLAGR